MIGVVAGIMMLVRPGSRGPAFVASVGEAWVNAAGATIRTNPQVAAAPKVKKKKSGSSGGSGGGGFDVPLIPGLPPGVGPNITIPNPLDYLPDLNPFD